MSANYMTFKINLPEFKDLLCVVNWLDYTSFSRISDADEVVDVEEFDSKDLAFARKLAPEMVMDLGYNKTPNSIAKKIIAKFDISAEAARLNTTEKKLQAFIVRSAKETFEECCNIEGYWGTWGNIGSHEWCINEPEVINMQAVQYRVKDGIFLWKELPAVADAVYVKFPSPHSRHGDSLINIIKNPGIMSALELYKWVKSDDVSMVCYSDNKFIYVKSEKEYHGDVVSVYGFAENIAVFRALEELDGFSGDFQFLVGCIDEDLNTWRLNAKKIETLRARLDIAYWVTLLRSIVNVSDIEIVNQVSKNHHGLLNSEAIEEIARAYDPELMAIRHLLYDLSKENGELDNVCYGWGRSLWVCEDSGTGKLRLCTDTRGASNLSGLSQNVIRNRFKKGQLQGSRNGPNIGIWVEPLFQNTGQKPIDIFMEFRAQKAQIDIGEKSCFELLADLKKEKQIHPL